MSLIKEFSRIIGDGKRQMAVAEAKPIYLQEEIGKGRELGNCLCKGDNKTFMKTLLEEYNMGGKINMIYIDPPFFSKSDYDAVLQASGHSIRHQAYGDKWERGLKDYLRMCSVRFMLMKELLAEDGLIFVHLDWHVVHYVKIVMDEIFGEKNFVNEIIWNYKSGGTSKRHFARKHDTILVYSKGPKYNFYPLKEKSYNRDFKPYRFKGVKEYKDENGWYTMVNMKDVWNIDMVGRTSSERTGYATQKPEQLLQRIIEASTVEGNICADFFSGSGTLAATANKMGRRFICCDQSSLATETAVARLADEKGEFVVCSMEKDEKSKFSIDYTVKDEEVPGTDKRLLTIELVGLKSKGMVRNVEKKSKDTVKEILKEDSLSMISSWSIDLNYDGKVHRPDAIFTRKNGELVTSFTHLITHKNVINIKAVDIFGNHIFLAKFQNDTLK